MWKISTHDGWTRAAFHIRTASGLDDSIPDWQIVPAFGPQYGESGGSFRPGTF